MELPVVLVEETSVRPIMVTCSFHKLGRSLTDKASVLLLQLSGTVFLSICQSINQI